MHSEHTKHVADLSDQSRLKKVDTAEFNCARLVQNKVFEHIGQIRLCSLTSTGCGSDFLNNLMMLFLLKITILDILNANA